MKLQMKHNYREFPLQIRDLGLNNILEAEEAAYKTEIEACPFCGSAPFLALQNVYGSAAVYIECNKCKCRTTLYSTAKNVVTWQPTQMKDCVARAANTWNKRA